MVGRLSQAPAGYVTHCVGHIDCHRPGTEDPGCASASRVWDPREDCTTSTYSNLAQSPHCQVGVDSGMEASGQTGQSLLCTPDPVPWRMGRDALRLRIRQILFYSTVDVSFCSMAHTSHPVQATWKATVRRQ